MKFIKLLIHITCTKKMYQCGFPKYSVRETLYNKSAINISSPDMWRFLVGTHTPPGQEKRKGWLSDLWHARSWTSESCAGWVRTRVLLPSELRHKCPAGGEQVVPQHSTSWFSLIALTSFFLFLFLLILSSYFVPYFKCNKWRIQGLRKWTKF